METGTTRRQFCGTVAAAAIVLPVLGVSERAAMAAGDNWVATVKPADLAAGYTVYKAGNFVLSRAGSKVVALDLTCTHKACAVKPGVDRKDREKNLLACPCHGGKYDSEGSVAGGPPRDALVRHPIRLSDGGVIEVNAGVKVKAGAAEGVLEVK